MASNRTGRTELRGDLQSEIMNVVWRLGESNVEQVREELSSKDLPAYNTVQTVLNRLVDRYVEQVREELSSKDLPAYNTVQTVLNRLVDREMLVRAKQGRAFLYSPALGESDYLERALGERLASATPEARKAALMNLVDQLDPGEVDEVAKRANSIRRRRSKSS